MTLSRLAWGAALFLIGVGYRARELRRVFTPEGMIPPTGSDEYYHLRRIWYSVVNFPETLERDGYAAFPFGGEVMWPPGFDLAVAALARALVGAEDQAAVEVVAAWVSPVFAGLTVVTTAAIGARVFSPAAGVLAGGLLAILPGHYFYSLVGMVDHHSAVSLSSAGMVLVAVTVLQRDAESPWWGRAIGLGLFGAFSLSIWPGALIQIGLLQAMASIWMLQAPSPALAISRAGHLVAAQLVAALALSPFALGRVWTEFGAFSPLVLTSFQPVWFAANGLACLLLARLWTRLPATAASAPRRWQCALGVAAAASLAGFAAIPGLVESLDLAAGWFREDDALLGRIRELRPLFGDPADPAWWGAQAELLLTRFVFVFPLALLFAGVTAARTGRSDRWLVVAWAGLTFAEASAQQRFTNGFAAPYSIVLGGAGAWLVIRARERLAGRPRAVRAVLAVAGLGGLAAVLQPSLALMSQIVPFFDPSAQVTVRPNHLRNAQYRQVAEWLSRNTPPTRGYLDASQRPEYAILARWDRGHLLRYEAERPVVQDNFAFYGGRRAFELAGDYYEAESESEALGILDELGARYVVVDRTGAAHGTQYSARSMAKRLYPYPAREKPGQESSLPLRFSGFRQHRLVLETEPRGPQAPGVRLYERVAGARIAGSAPPDTVVRAELELRSPSREQPGSYRTSVRSSAEGRYLLRLPYATGAKGAIESAGRYLLRCGGRPGAVASVEVSEAAVQGGEELAGPVLTCLGGPSALGP